ncbi:MAG: TorF family putative porin [Phenylobacterium sp.]
MTSFKLAAVAATAALALGTAAQAQDKPEFSFNVGVASDYVFRGFSQTDSNPQVYGGADVGIGIFYAGTWLSNVDFGDSTDMEYDLYAGFKPTLGPVSLDVGIVRYGYTNQSDGADLDFWEGKVAGSIPAGKGTVGAAVYYTPENFNQTGKATYVELNGSMPVTDKLSVSGAIGHQSLEGPLDYETWNLGVGYAINDVFGIDLRYWDTNVEKADDPFKVSTGRVVVGLKAAF